MIRTSSDDRTVAAVQAYVASTSDRLVELYKPEMPNPIAVRLPREIGFSGLLRRKWALLARRKFPARSHLDGRLATCGRLSNWPILLKIPGQRDSQSRAGAHPASHWIRYFIRI